MRNASWTKPGGADIDDGALAELVFHLKVPGGGIIADVGLTRSLVVEPMERELAGAKARGAWYALVVICHNNGYYTRCG